MSTIQEQIIEFCRESEPSGEKSQAIAAAVKAQESLLVAFFPKTKHYFITREYNRQTAVVFSERDTFERFAQSCMERGLHVTAIENRDADRTLLFADLWRCGFTNVMVDFQPHFVILPLHMLFTPPDYSGMPLAQRPVLSPGMTGKLLWFLQQMHAGEADGRLELELLTELYHSPFLFPVRQEADGTPSVPAVRTPEGKVQCRIFTDRREWAAAGLPEEYVPTIARYDDLVKLLGRGVDVVVINPGSGAELSLDAALLELAEKAATGLTGDMVLRSQNEEGVKVTISTPAPWPEELAEHLSACLREHPEVKAAYLRMVSRSDSFRPHYMIILDCTEDRGQQALYKALAEAAKPYVSGWDLEFSSYQKAEKWTGSKGPFYRKKRFQK